MSLLMVVNRKELIFSPSTTSSYCRGRKSIKDPFLFQALAFICLGPLPSKASLQYVIRTRPKKRVLTIWYSREETIPRRNKAYLCYQNQMQIDPYEKGVMYLKLYSQNFTLSLHIQQRKCILAVSTIINKPFKNSIHNTVDMV